MAEFGSSDSGASLGDILGAAISKAQKAKSEEDEDEAKKAKKKSKKRPRRSSRPALRAFWRFRDRPDAPSRALFVPFARHSGSRAKTVLSERLILDARGRLWHCSRQKAAGTLPRRLGDMRMTKSELILRIGELNPHLYHRDVERIVATIFDEIATALARGDRVELRGFGAFSVKHRDARTGRNPRTGDPVEVSRKAIPFFKTGKQLRDRLNGGQD